jgi:hypothetical protein
MKLSNFVNISYIKTHALLLFMYIYHIVSSDCFFGIF